MFKRLITLGAGLALVAGLATPALAVQRTGSMSVSATQSTPCTVTKVADLSFGTNDFAEGHDLNETSGGGHPGELDLTCGDDDTTVAFDNGNHFDGTIRHMDDGSGNEISYLLCSNAATSQSDCTQFPLALADNRNGGSDTATDKVYVHGIVPDGGQNDQHDAYYSDTVGYTVSVNV